MIKFRKHGIRWRIAMLYLSILTVGLGIFCTLLFHYFQRIQIQAFDSTLYNFAVDISTNLEMDLVGRLFVVNPNVTDAGKFFPFHLGSSYLEIRDSKGRVLLHSRSLGNRNLPMSPETLSTIKDERAIFRTELASGLGLTSTSSELRLLTFWAHHPSWREPLILQVAVPLDLPQREQRDLLLFFALGIPTFLLCAGAAGVWMSKRALKPVHDITIKARGITGVEKLKERIPVSEAQDEIHELANTFNELLDRLDTAFASQDRFVANASHQLKTPLTILKGELEFMVKANEQGEDMRIGLASVTAEINRLISLVEDLLLLARLEAGRDTISFSPVRLDEVLLRVVARLQKLAHHKGVQITTHLGSERPDAELDVTIMGDEELLDSMIENLVENAVKYAPENSVVELRMFTRSHFVELDIIDSGPGIPPELRQNIFERFTRIKPSNIVPGSGLGLSIAAEIARIHKIEVDLKSSSAGSRFQIRATVSQPQA